MWCPRHPPPSLVRLLLPLSLPDLLPLLVSASLLIRSALCPTGKASTADLLRFFSFLGPHLFHDVTLPVSLTSPHVLHTFLLSAPSKTLDISSLISKAASSFPSLPAPPSSSPAR
ncbi:hypothetical protein J5N97_009653 [Dioscorea zingiberensis]|uniref:Secreted protein n=1 Tax=Dioscorea zingiberensis TaxID=325984 RepID=A0A9D5CZS8_9LILI|nr:hypothetical protein J5N97_009653 [Dioscorea zingiberensis]